MVPTVATPETANDTGTGPQRPPDITGVAAGYTEDDTRFVAAGHSASWFDDRVRYVGVVGWADVNAKYYVGGRPFGFNVAGILLYQDVRFRIGSSRLFLGAKLSALDADASLNLGLGGSGILPGGIGETTTVGIAGQASYDRRDTTFTPSNGQLVTLEMWRYDEALGGDYGYTKARFRGLTFHPLGSHLVLGLRLEVAAVTGRPPFWGDPWVVLRGIPAMRYQNDSTGVAEAELRWTFARRWGAVGFFGAGATDGDRRGADPDDDIHAGGVGLRYLFKEALGLWVGVDLAKGPEDEVAYIQVGHAW
jgi:hypothetical protein